MELWIINHQTPHEIHVIHDQFMDLGPELLILYEMVSDHDRSLYVIGVTTWLVQISCLAILHTIHKMEIPKCGGFKY